jgi:hypothetical protein
MVVLEMPGLLSGPCPILGDRNNCRYNGDPSFRVLSITLLGKIMFWALITVCKTMYKKHVIELIKPQYKHGLFFAFLSKAAPKCRCFSLAQCFQWWWG